MTQAARLIPEWERLYVLATSTMAARRGESLPSAVLERLRVLQQKVFDLRRTPPWSPLLDRYNLNAVDQDITACVIAPEAEPRIGWLYHDLQAGVASTYPTPALIGELFAMGVEESEVLEQRLHPDAPLRRYRLIEWPEADLYHPMRSTGLLRSQLLRRPCLDRKISGATEVVDLGDWNDLVLPVSVKKRLEEILLWETQRDKVGRLWGARFVGGPVVLFSGLSGTGKTFAAEGLAHRLAKPLYRVDLGLLVSKYIGETEKNLNALFDSAAGEDVVLLFDEADSLFGKRGEVKDARDRYANMEVSHLLTRIERHQGVCILTTNLRRHLDPAFVRRFQFVIEFPAPDAEARRELWSALIPPGAGLESDVELDEIARSVVMTGGEIRNAALHAAFLAAGDDEVICNRHLARAVWNELEKRGSDLLPSRMGCLNAYLQETFREAS